MTSPGPCLLTVDSCFSLPLYFPWFVSGFLKQRGQDTSVDKQPLERQWTPSQDTSRLAPQVHSLCKGGKSTLRHQPELGRNRLSH